MKTQTSTRISERRQRGFSLIELMVAITLGFIVVGAVGYLFLGSRQSFRTTDNLSRMQENARYALETMARDVRMAGYIGCRNLQTMEEEGVNTIENPPVLDLSSGSAITGEETGIATPNYRGTITRVAGDAVTIMGAFGGGVNLTGNLATNANVQIVGNPYGFKKDDALIVSSCGNATVFRATSVSASGGIVTVAHANNTNTENRLGTYVSTDVVMKMEQYTYFIGTNPAGNRALYRASLTEGTVELVEGVWDMQIEYGVDTTVLPDGTAEEYQTATAVGANWPQVISARISLLVVGEDNTLTAPQTYTFNGGPITPAVAAPDRLRLHQVFTTTVGLRNRLP